MEWVADYIGLVWTFLSSFTIPIINISYTSLLIGVLVIGVSLSVLRQLLGVGAGGLHVKYRSGNGGRAYGVSKERRNDSK